jgi:hypothetical protein
MRTSAVTEIKGLENLPAEQQATIKAQLEEALKSGKPIPKFTFTPSTTTSSSKSGGGLLVLAFIVLVILFTVLFKMLR